MRAAVFLVLFSAMLLPSLAFAEAGAANYKAHCAACHGAKGAGDTMIGKNLNLRSLGSEQVQKEPDEELYMIISKGEKNRMPAYGNKLTKDQIHDLVRYIRSLKQ